jgi:phosphate transport system protein
MTPTPRRDESFVRTPNCRNLGNLGSEKGYGANMAQRALPEDGTERASAQSDSAPEYFGTVVPLEGEPGIHPAGRGLETGRIQGDDSAELELIDRHVIQLFALVENAVAGATHALVSADREAARNLVAADADIDDLYQALEASVQARLLERPSDPAQAQYLLAVLGMLPELERSGDLAEHVARRATRNLPAEMPARLRGYVQRMGEVACAMWHIAGDAFGGDSPGATEQLESLDDEMDDLHVTFIAELVAAGIAVEVAIELALVGRFYERLGDHAVNLARRVPTRPRPIAP